MKTVNIYQLLSIIIALSLTGSSSKTNMNSNAMYTKQLRILVKARPVTRQACNSQQHIHEVVLSLDTVEPHFAWPLKVAAIRLGVGETALKW